MKKVFAVAIALAMVLSLFAISSYAGGGICFDGAYLTNDADGSQHATAHVPNEGETNLTNQAAQGDMGSIYGSGFQYFHAQGWWSDDEELADFGIQVNDGEITWGQKIDDPNLVAVKDQTGHAYPYRFNFTLPVQEGEVAIKMYKKTAAGAEEVFHTLTYSNSAPTGDKFVPIAVADNDGAPGNAVWLNEKGEWAAVKFTTAAKLGGVSLFHWASNGSNGPLATWKLEVFKFDTDIDTTFSKAPVASKSQQSAGDNNPAFALEFDAPLDPGTYVIRLEITNDEATGVSQETSYVVFPATAAAVSEDKFEYINTNGVMFNFTVVAPDTYSAADFFVTNPAGGSEPTPVDPGTEPTPVTGDATMVLFIVAAVAVALVILKKKAF